MNIRRSESILGNHNLKRLISSTRPDPMADTPHTGDNIVFDFVSKLDHGYNEQDAIVDALVSAHAVIKGLTETVLDHARFSTTVKPIIINNK